MKNKRFSFSTTQIILLSFLVTILIGSILLWLPISVAGGQTLSYVDALFMATTSTCVTGLVTMPTVATWSIFGQVIILILIQVGGLGIVTIMSGLMVLLNRQMGIGDRLLLQDALNLNTMSGLAKFIKNVLFGTLLVEGIGALLYMPVFVPQFGARGIWISVFHSVSAFCNAGIDIVAENSLCNYVNHPLVNAVTMGLIILGGLGYIVWWDVLRVLRSRTSQKKRIFRHLTLHSKIAIVATAGLIVVGALLIFVLEYSNPLTIRDMSLLQKMQAALFQSVTTRTAGFATLPQENLTDASAMICLLLMMIGGSPVGTAGGIKTVTFAVLFFSAMATIRNKNDATVFGRRIAPDSIRKALAVVATFLAICFTAIVLLLATTDMQVLDALYEVVSATATVGLSRNVTGSLNLVGKFIIIGTMYLGRVGPISLAIALGSKKSSPNLISEPTEEISIG